MLMLKMHITLSITLYVKIITRKSNQLCSSLGLVRQSNTRTSWIIYIFDEQTKEKIKTIIDITVSKRNTRQCYRYFLSTFFFFSMPHVHVLQYIIFYRCRMSYAVRFINPILCLCKLERITFRSMHK